VSFIAVTNHEKVKGLDLNLLTFARASDSNPEMEEMLNKSVEVVVVMLC